MKSWSQNKTEQFWLHDKVMKDVIGSYVSRLAATFDFSLKSFVDI